jgi:hypothetical protein
VALSHRLITDEQTRLVATFKLNRGDKSRLKLLFLYCTQAEIISKATPSVKSPIKNLADVNKSVNVQQLLTAIGYEFLRTPADKLIDGGRELVMQQRGFQLINPTEKWFPGLSELRENFASWDWRFGKTPKFNVQKTIQLKAGDECHNLKLNVEVEKVRLAARVVEKNYFYSFNLCSLVGTDKQDRFAS